VFIRHTGQKEPPPPIGLRPATSVTTITFEGIEGGGCGRG